MTSEVDQAPRRPRVVAIVQARLGSTRLPGKVLRPLAGRPMLSHMIERLQQARLLADILIATTSLAQDHRIIELARQAGVASYAGPVDDVLARHVGAAQKAGADVIVRITADCPLIDPQTVDSAVQYFLAHDYDFVDDGAERALPRGLDVSVFSRQALERADLAAQDAASREHVTLYMYRHPDQFRVGQFPVSPELHHPEWRLCVDEEDDFKLIEEIYRRLYQPGSIIDMRAVARLLESEPALLQINAHVQQKAV